MLLLGATISIAAVSGTTAAAQQPQRSCAPATLAGGAGFDTLIGTPGADRIEAREGDDLANGVAGDDCIAGGDGFDEIGGGRATT